MPIDFSITDDKIVTYQIPMNMTHTWKEKDAYGEFKTMPYWPWTRKNISTITIPYKLSVLGIDFQPET
jgi:hypothetical protein